MIAAQYDFNAGFDPSALSSITAAQFLQMIQQMAPLGNIGGVIEGAGASLNASIPQGVGSPSVTNNPRFARYIWLNTFNAAAAAPTPYYYDASSGNWTSGSIAAGSITNAMINAAAEISVSKLADGAANEVLVTDAAGTGVEWKSVASLLAALNDSVPLTAIDDTAAVGAESFLRRVGSTAVWKTFTETVTSIQAALNGVAPGVLTPGANNTILGTDSSGVVAFNTPDSIIANLAIGLAKLAQGGAVAGDILSWNGTSWVKVTPSQAIATSATISTTGIQGAIALSSATLTETFVHGFNPSTPRNIRVVVRCTVNDAASGYQAGDEIEAYSWHETTGAETVLFAVTSNATNIIVSRVANGGNVLVVPRAGGNPVAPTALSSFVPKVYAWL